MLLPLAFVLLAAVPTAWLGRLPPVCLWRNLLGWECPSCGMTRAFSSVLHGQWQAAWDYNHLVVVAFPPLAALALGDVLTLLRGAARTFRNGGPDTL